MSWGEFLWSWKGRLNRLQFLFGLHGLALVTFVLSYVLLPILASEDMVGSGYRATDRVNQVMMFSALPAIPFQASMLVLRVHDLDHSGWLVLAWFAAACLLSAMLSVFPDYRALLEWLGLLIALVFLWIAFAPGAPTANDYGPPPAAGWWP